MTVKQQIRLFFILLMVVRGANSQETRLVSNEEANQHLTKRVQPKYPSLAEMAHIQGDVLLRVMIDERGRVSEAKGVSGHPMLLEAAIPAVKSWQFEPFTEDGKPAAVNALVKIAFDLGPGAELHGQYLQQEAECNGQLHNSTGPQAEAACKKALATAMKLPSHFVSAKMKAYENAGKAAYAAKDGAEALADFQQQLIFAQQALQPGNPLMIQVRSNLAHAYEATGKLPEADTEYTEMEKAQEASVAELKKRNENLKRGAADGVNTSYAHNMQIILQEHARLLRRMGKITEAEALEQKANSLNESR
ncbi:MAG TPA: TonB family protein [Candidatus Angelobacter sp.]|nr:TonB family protein [Candidatus Angelobacter sp.]